VYWEQCGDEAAWCDGRSSLVGADWPAYIKLIDHNFPLGHAARWLLGGSDTEASMWLVVDRWTEWAWLVPADEAWTVLRMQWADRSPLAEAVAQSMPAVLSVEELMAALDAAVAQARLDRRNGRDMDFAQVMAQQHERDVAFAAALRGRRL
jgi:hypothetical protein